MKFNHNLKGTQGNNYFTYRNNQVNTLSHGVFSLLKKVTLIESFISLTFYQCWFVV